MIISDLTHQRNQAEAHPSFTPETVRKCLAAINQEDKEVIEKCLNVLQKLV